MNTFSNSLFTFLFGWARTLFSGVWNAFAEGRLSGFLTWLGDHWLGLVIMLCLIGTALDFLIWIIRWRPYLVWRSTLRRWGRRLRGEKIDSERRFTRGYQEAVELNLPAAAPEAPAAMPTPVPAAPPEPAPAPSFASPVPEEFFEQPPVREESAWMSGVPESRRRRRSERYETVKKPLWRPRFPVLGDQDDDGLLDGLPPAVDQQQAFHEPVYPTAPSRWTSDDPSKQEKQA